MFQNLRLFFYSAVLGLALGLILPSVLIAGTEIDFGLTSRTGPVSSEVTTVDIKHTKGVFVVSGSFDYSENYGDRVNEQYKMTIGYDPHLNDVWSLWFLEEAAKDELGRSIRCENKVGGGLKYRFADSENLKISLSGGLIEHYVDLIKGDSDTIARFSVRPKISWARDKWKIEGVGFYQPNVEAKEDFILSGKLSVRYALTEVVGLSIKGTDDYRSVSASNENNDLRIGLYLSIKI